VVAAAHRKAVVAAASKTSVRRKCNSNATALPAMRQRILPGGILVSFFSLPDQWGMLQLLLCALSLGACVMSPW
jgi:hypothetical protein